MSSTKRLRHEVESVDEFTPLFSSPHVKADPLKRLKRMPSSTETPPSPSLSWMGICILCFLLSLAGFMIFSFIRVENVLAHLPLRTQVMVGSIAAVALLISTPLTHGLAGTRLHGVYSFYQPFVGGSTFIVLQIIAWSSYTIMIVSLASALYIFVHNISHLNIGYVSFSAGLGGFVSQIAVWLSLRYFDGRRKWYVKERQLARVFSAPRLLRDLQSFAIVSFLYQMPIILVATVIAIIYTGKLYGALFLTCVSAIYSMTYSDNPHHTGDRSWDFIRRNTDFWASLEHYFSFSIIPVGKLEPDAKYMFAFHPHGIYPLTVVWGTRGQQWREHYSDIELDVLSASIVHYIPVIRDLIMWAGGRDVSKKAIDLAFRQNRSIMLVPGGEREMRETRPECKDITVVTSHKGFIRLALKYGTDLVPVISFGENQKLDNIRLPGVQEWFQKRTLYGFPHLPYGRWYSPIPNPVPISMAVGPPISIPHIPEPTQQDIDEFHFHYYTTLRELFDQTKVQVPGFEEAQLLYTQPLKPPPK